MSGIDMHIHSTASDGRYSVREIAMQAKAIGLDGIAITDHDTVQGLKDLAAISQDIGLSIFPGIEISTVWEGKSIHVLGYLFDPHHQGLLTWLEKRQMERVARAKNILAQLRDHGILLREEDILIQQNLGSLGRVHIGQAMIAAGYAHTLDQVFHKWLGEDGPIAIPPHQVTPKDALEVIHQAGGVCAIAHPGLSGCDQWLELFCSWGLDGVEAYHPEHKKKQRKRYVQFAGAQQLFVTAGSDFHRDGLGRCTIALELLPEVFHSFVNHK